MKHINYPKILHFRNVIDGLKHQIQFQGYDDDNNPIYKEPDVWPTVTFNGTVKLHGTNGAVCWNKNDGMWFQSRERILSLEHDNAGFYAFCKAREVLFSVLIEKCRGASKLYYVPYDYTISIFGEFVGKKIQSGVAISNLDKSFFIFGVKVTPHDETIKPFWLNDFNLFTHLYDTVIKNNIFCIEWYQKFNVTIDLNHPEKSVQLIEDLTKEVEEECPIAKQFGHSGIGEGIVWQLNYDGINHRFKTKGEKHHVKKQKSIIEMCPETMKSLQEFADKTVTQNRMNQAVDVAKENRLVDVRILGDVMKWIVNDILTEEQDVIIKNEFDVKQVKKALSQKAKTMFFEIINKNDRN